MYAHSLELLEAVLERPLMTGLVEAGPLPGPGARPRTTNGL